MNAPSDQLAPVGWVCTRNDPTEIVFEHEELPSAVRTVRESEDQWRVELTEHAGEAESVRTVGYACTRDRALDALSTTMSAMNRVADRTGVVRTMMASTLALYDDAGVRRNSPEWRTADRPFERRMAGGTPREPWYPGDAEPSAAGSAAAETGDAADGGVAAESVGGGSDGADGGAANGSPDADGSETGTDVGESAGTGPKSDGDRSADGE